jgi:hypothetical protein
MSERDKRLAQQYAAKGKISANESNRLRQQAQATPANGDGMDATRAAIAAPRTQESLDRAANHKRGLPKLG